MSRILTFAAVLSVLMLQAAPAEAQNRFALVMGNDNYQNVPALTKARGDAEAMKARLEQFGFKVDLLIDADRRRLNVAVSAFTNKLQAGDVALIHYSGHGVTLDGENFLLPIDVPAPGSADKELLKAEAVGLTNLIERIKGAGARTQIFIIDACRDNPYAQAGTRSVGLTRGLARVDAPKGTFIMYSAGYGQTALDRLGERDPEPTSVYTRTLLRKMAEMKPITDLAREIRDDVEAAAGSIGHQQRPAYYDELSGAGFFFPTSAGTIPSNSRAEAPSNSPTQPLPPTINAAQPQQYALRGSGLVFPDSDRRYLSSAELQGLPRAQLRIARNEIFARRGRYFRDQALVAHFSQFPWYRPYHWSDSEANLNAFERANLKLIQSFER
jgi:hypothetical protein